MPRIVIVAEQPNAALLVEELRALPELHSADLQETAIGTDDGSLANADFVSILIDIAVGMVSAGAYDLVKAAVTNARRRGSVTYKVENEGESASPTPEDDAGDSEEPA